MTENDGARFLAISGGLARRKRVPFSFAGIGGEESGSIWDYDYDYD